MLGTAITGFSIWRWPHAVPPLAVAPFILLAGLLLRIQRLNHVFALNGLILTRLLEKPLGRPDWHAIGRSLARIAAGCAALAVAAFFAEAGARELALHSGLAPKLAQIAGVLAGLAAGMATYFASARLLKSPELTDFITAFRGRRRRARA